MAGQGRLHGNPCGFKIPHFTNHDNVRVLPDDGAQRIGKIQADLWFHLDLVNAFQLILHRIFYRKDFLLRSIQRLQGGIQSGRFAAAGWPGNQDNTVRQCQDVVETRYCCRIKSQQVQVQNNLFFIQDAQYHALAV